MLRYSIFLLTLVAVCRAQAPAGGGADVFPSLQDRVEELETHVQRLELQVGILQGKIVVRDGQYQVRAGDTAAKIARMFEISIMDLTDLNPGHAWAKLKLGQFVRVIPKTVPNQSKDPTP
jgi:hypothetical protein